ncbi:hypothetical protein [Pseudomonas sp. 2FG]|uniref:hypothetical protein n=1 Tax=Pseudomonas sp. 2FG TaxID=2502191 RepID=UPI0010F600A2|nr:hypothetical protein [Pseudomonas sp. 2FG]
MFCRSMLLAVLSLFLSGCAVYDYDYDDDRSYPRYSDGGHNYGGGYNVQRHDGYRSPRYYDYDTRRYDTRRYDGRRYDHHQYQQQRYVAPPRYQPPAPRYYSPTRHPSRRGWEQGDRGGYQAPQMQGQRHDYRPTHRVDSPRRERERERDHDQDRNRDHHRDRDHDRRQLN